MFSCWFSWLVFGVSSVVSFRLFYMYFVCFDFTGLCDCVLCCGLLVWLFVIAVFVACNRCLCFSGCLFSVWYLVVFGILLLLLVDFG